MENKKIEAAVFAQATGSIRIFEKKLLNGVGVERVIGSGNAIEAMRTLGQSTTYDFASVKRPEDYETALRSGLKATYETLRAICPVDEIVDVCALKYDYHNIKTAIKARRTNEKNPAYCDYSRLDKDLIIKYVGSDSGEENVGDKISREIGLDKGVVENPDAPPKYFETLIKPSVNKCKEVFEETDDPQLLDVECDKEMYAAILSMCALINSAFITDYFKYSIDIQNVRSLMRVKNMRKGLKFLRNALIDGGFVDKAVYLDFYDKPVEAVGSALYFKYYGTTVKPALDDYNKLKNFSSLERMTDNYLMEHIRKAKQVAFGPENVFAYLIAKENEVRQARILMTCKINGISDETLRERLRDNYA